MNSKIEVDQLINEKDDRIIIFEKEQERFRQEIRDLKSDVLSYKNKVSEKKLSYEKLQNFAENLEKQVSYA